MKLRQLSKGLLSASIVVVFLLSALASLPQTQAIGKIQVLHSRTFTQKAWWGNFDHSLKIPSWGEVSLFYDVSEVVGSAWILVNGWDASGNWWVDEQVVDHVGVYESQYRFSFFDDPQPIDVYLNDGCSITFSISQSPWGQIRSGDVRS